MKNTFFGRESRGRALAGALAALGVMTLAGCGGGGGGDNSTPQAPAIPALDGHVIHNPFGLDGQAFSVVLHPGVAPVLRGRAVSGTGTQVVKQFGNFGPVPTTVNLTDISTLLTLSRVTLTLPQGSTTLPNTLTVNSLSANIQVMDVGAQSSQTFNASLPGPITLTLQPDNSYAPTAGTSLSLTDVIPANQLGALQTILVTGAANSAAVTLTVNVSPDLPDNTQFNVVLANSQLQADVTPKSTGGGGGNPTPGNAGVFVATLSNSGPFPFTDPSTGGTTQAAYNGNPSTAPVNFGFDTSVDNATSAHVLTGTGQDETKTRGIVIRIANSSPNLTSGQIYSLGAGTTNTVTYSEGTAKVWVASAGSLTLDAPSPLTPTGELVTVANAAGGVGGATMIPDTTVPGNTARGTFTLRVTNPSSP